MNETRGCMDIQGKNALVTGGAHRLGKAIALALALAGANIAIHYHRSREQAETTLTELRAWGVHAEAIQGDLSVVVEAERVVDQAVAALGGLSILVNSAGIWGKTPLGSVTEARWDELIDTNTRSAFFIAQRAAPYLRQAHGVIINIADVGVLRPWKNYTPYLVSKGGIVTLTEALAKDLAPEVRVNAIAPGPVLLPNDWGVEEHERTAKTVLLGRVGTPEDVAQAALYLASADFVTGVILPVDGGQRLI